LRTKIFGRGRPAADVISYRDKLGVSDPDRPALGRLRSETAGSLTPRIVLSVFCTGRQKTPPNREAVDGTGKIRAF
jgi:hypothetical protein